MKKTLFVLVASLISLLFASCGQCGTQTESFEAKIVSVEKVDSLGYELVTSEVYPGQGDTMTVWIALPLGQWDGRLVGKGGGGHVAGRPSGAIEMAMKGMVGVSCDCGHRVAGWSFLYDEANGCLNEVQARDFGHYGLHVMTVYAKQYLAQRYGYGPHHCYFTGSSTGGRQALQVADKYPYDYDAIFAGCPAWRNDLYIPARAWAQIVMKDEGRLVPLYKFNYAKDALIAFEDPKDGLVDGIVNNPFELSFDIESIIGAKVGPDAQDEITEEDVRIIKRVWDGCPYQGGKLWYYITPSASFHRFARSEGNPPVGQFEPTTLGILRYGVEFNPELSLEDMSVERYFKDFFASRESLEPYMASSPDISAFRKKGGKLLIMHGLDDDMVPPGGTMRYYEEMCKAVGGKRKAEDFMRLFLVPGVNHGFKGPGANLRENDVQLLIDWVENGKAPDKIIFSREGFGSRPFYPYPYTTIYKGGDIDNPESFEPSLQDKESYDEHVASVKWIDKLF